MRIASRASPSMTHRFARGLTDGEAHAGRVMAKPTPGPWFMGSTQRADSVDIGADDNSNVALVYTMEGDVEDAATGRANARLIRAAPDLLEACRGVVEKGGFDHTDMMRIRAAYAKATGGDDDEA